MFMLEFGLTPQGSNLFLEVAEHLCLDEEVEESAQTKDPAQYQVKGHMLE